MIDLEVEEADSRRCMSYGSCARLFACCDMCNTSLARSKRCVELVSLCNGEMVSLIDRVNLLVEVSTS